MAERKPQPPQDPLELVLGAKDRVRITERGAPHYGEKGTVRRVELDAGLLVITVELDNGKTETYAPDELYRTRKYVRPYTRNWLYT